METFKSFDSELYRINDETFPRIAFDIFRFQAQHNPVYQSFLGHLRIDPDKITALEEIPFLPISFFKSYTVKTGSWEATTTFTSSGTTGVNTSRHAVRDTSFYLKHSQQCFEQFFGPLDQYHILALLPSYLERQGSSLIAMIDHFIQESRSPFSGFYLYETDKLLNDIQACKNDGRKTILWGVSFALLDLADQYEIDLEHCLIFETGGMKGRRKEITRQELHQYLRARLNAKNIYSEYGMTELLSQAYTLGSTTFFCPPSMKIIGREITDPMRKGLQNETCGINVIDLANWNTISFIETEDLGRISPDGSFEVLGRMDNSDVRGCNLLI